MSHRQLPTKGACLDDQRATVGHRQGHRLFEQHVAARFECGRRYLEMRVARCHHVHDVQSARREERLVIGIDRDPGMSGRRSGAGRGGRRRDAREAGVGQSRDGLGVQLPPGAEANETETNRGWGSGH